MNSEMTRLIRSLLPSAWAGCVILWAVPHAYTAAPTLAELEQKAINYRLQNAKQGYVRMSVVNEGDSPRQQVECLWETTFDAKRVKQVRRCRLRGKTEWGEPKITIVTPDMTVIDYEFSKESPVRTNPPSDNRVRRGKVRVLNMQALGMDTGGADSLDTADVESVLNRFDRATTVVQADVREGIDTWRIDSKEESQNPPSDTRLSVWIAPNQGYSIVGIEKRVNKNARQFITLIDCKLKEYPTIRAWYPSTILKILKTQERVVERQVITIEDARFGETLDDGAFTLSSLELEPGRKVLDSSSGQAWAKVWTGDELVTPSVGRVPVSPPVLPKSNKRWWLGAVAIALALIAIFYCWRVARDRKQSTNVPPSA